MGLKADNWIRKMALEHQMIEPFCEANIGKGVVSYGLSSYGYDIRVGREFKIFTNVNFYRSGSKKFFRRKCGGF